MKPGEQQNGSVPIGAEELALRVRCVGTGPEMVCLSFTLEANDGSPPLQLGEVVVPVGESAVVALLTARVVLTVPERGS